MKSQIRRKWENQQGVAAIEFAIVLPLLVILLLGIIEFSTLFYDKAMITNASREGAREGIVYRFDPTTGTSGHPTDQEITDTVDNYIQNYLISLGSPSTAQTVITRAGTASGDPLTVTVTYPYYFLVLPNFITDLTGPINLSATTVMRME